jgi:hypothetical protein
MQHPLTENDLRKYCVTYNGDAVEKVRAAYFVQDGDLITFKNHDHKVIFAARRDMVVSVRDTTDDVAVSDESGVHTVVLCPKCGG